jgi:hypothetical protein
MIDQTIILRSAEIRLIFHRDLREVAFLVWAEIVLTACWGFECATAELVLLARRAHSVQRVQSWRAKALTNMSSPLGPSPVVHISTIGARFVQIRRLVTPNIAVIAARWQLWRKWF